MSFCSCVNLTERCRSRDSAASNKSCERKNSWCWIGFHGIHHSPGDDDPAVPSDEVFGPQQRSLVSIRKEDCECRLLFAAIRSVPRVGGSKYPYFHEALENASPMKPGSVPGRRTGNANAHLPCSFSFSSFPCCLVFHGFPNLLFYVLSKRQTTILVALDLLSLSLMPLGSKTSIETRCPRVRLSMSQCRKQLYCRQTDQIRIGSSICQRGLKELSIIYGNSEWTY